MLLSGRAVSIVLFVKTAALEQHYTVVALGSSWQYLIVPKDAVLYRMMLSGVSVFASLLTNEQINFQTQIQIDNRIWPKFTPVIAITVWVCENPMAVQTTWHLRSAPYVNTYELLI